MAGTGVVRAVQRVRGIEPGVVLFVIGIALACYLQGAFYPRAQFIIAAPLVVGALLAPTAPVFSRRDLGIAVTAGGLAVWALIDGAPTGHLGGGVRYVVLVAGVVGVAGVCRQMSGTARLDLVNGLLLVCCAVAALGWLGVVAFHSPWGFLSGGLWRASSTLTYPNAAAAVLAMAALVCLALRAADPIDRGLGGVATILLLGLGATLSRAGLGALLVGLVVIGVGVGWRPLPRAAVGPVLGAVVGMTGLVPAITAPTPTVFTVVVAVLTAVAGVLIGCRVRATRLVLAIFGAALVAALVLVSCWLAPRFTFGSPDRWGSFQAAWDLFLRHPVSGAGPGIEQVVLERAGGGVGVYRFVHNEYLQILAELGVLGVVLVIALLVVVARRLWRDRTAAGALGVAGLAALAALAVHAGFDFVWHVPVVPLLAAAFVGVALPQPCPKPTVPKGK